MSILFDVSGKSFLIDLLGLHITVGAHLKGRDTGCPNIYCVSIEWFLEILAFVASDVCLWVLHITLATHTRKEGMQDAKTICVYLVSGCWKPLLFYQTSVSGFLVGTESPPN